MSENSKIEWTDHTFNPWSGCTKVSPGCLHCYAETLDKRHLREKVDHWGKGAPRLPSTEKNWRQPLKWNAGPVVCAFCGKTFGIEQAHACVPVGEIRAAGQLKWRRPRVFCASLADWLDDEVPIEWLARLLATIHATPNLDWLLLTKRPGNWEARIEAAFECYSGGALCGADGDRDWMLPWLDAWLAGGKPSNVWIGTTVEDQVRADERIPQLLAIPARVRFLSCEPLLGPLDLREHLGSGLDVGLPMINWLICGGESGPGARPMHPKWARDLRDQCAAAGVPFLFKQWGEWLPGEEHFTGPEWKFQDGSIFDSHFFPADLTNHTAKGWDYDLESTVVWRRVGKHAAGRLLDGVEHSAFPPNDEALPPRT